MTLVCFACHNLGDIAYVDQIDREYCATCASDLLIGSVARGMRFRARRIPFKAAITAGGLYDAMGAVVGVDFDQRVSSVVFHLRMDVGNAVAAEAVE